MSARIQRPLVILLFLCAAPTILRADEFTDFRVPPNQFLQWTGSAFGATNWSHATQGPDHFTSGALQGSLQSSLALWRESDTRLLWVNASLSNQGNREHSRTQAYYANSGSPLFDVDSSGRSQRDLSELIAVSASQRWYPGGGPWNLAADLAGSLNDSQYWSHNQSSSRRPLSFIDYSSEVRGSSERRYRTNLSGGLGFGFGRVRNATGVYEARVLEDRLRASGALNRPLGPEARRRLAALMYARGDFDASMDRPASPVWDAVERILQEDGALSGPSLSARDLFRLIEPFVGNFAGFDPSRNGLPSSPIVRAVGWNLGTTVNGRTERESDWYDFTSTYFVSDSGVPQPPFEYRNGGHSRSSFDALSAGLSAEYHRPVSMRLQWDAAIHGSVPLRHKDRGFQLGAETGLNWIVADRWIASLSGRQSRIVDQNERSETRRDTWATNVSAAAYYFVTDHVTLRLAASQSWSKVPNGYFLFYFPASALSNQGYINFGLTYRFAGFTRVEGLFPANTTVN